MNKEVLSENYKKTISEIKNIKEEKEKEKKEINKITSIYSDEIDKEKAKLLKQINDEVRNGNDIFEQLNNLSNMFDSFSDEEAIKKVKDWQSEKTVII